MCAEFQTMWLNALVPTGVVGVNEPDTATRRPNKDLW